MSKQLKPCPFCGNTKLKVNDFSANYVYCEECGSEGPVSSNFEEAVKLWNKRG